MGSAGYRRERINSCLSSYFQAFQDRVLQKGRNQPYGTAYNRECQIILCADTPIMFWRPPIFGAELKGTGLEEASDFFQPAFKKQRPVFADEGYVSKTKEALGTLSEYSQDPCQLQIFFFFQGSFVRAMQKSRPTSLFQLSSVPAIIDLRRKRHVEQLCQLLPANS